MSRVRRWRLRLTSESLAGVGDDEWEEGENTSGD